VIPFGTYHPDCRNWQQEIQRLRASGIKGIKLHPEFQGIDLADPRLKDFFEEVQSDFVLMVHVGDRQTCHTNLSTPQKLANILDEFHNLRVIAAHMGGYLFWEEVLQSLVGRDIFLDTSSTLPFIDPELFRRIVSKHGTDRILFGSDYPLRAPQQDLPLLDAIPWLNDDAKEAIKGWNCARLLGIGS
jgi:predicted TIM-barrel fold metal-dependent hydrolase